MSEWLCCTQVRRVCIAESLFSTPPLFRYAQTGVIKEGRKDKEWRPR